MNNHIYLCYEDGDNNDIILEEIPVGMDDSTNNGNNNVENNVTPSDNNPNDMQNSFNVENNNPYTSENIQTEQQVSPDDDDYDDDDDEGSIFMDKTLTSFGLTALFILIILAVAIFINNKRGLIESQPYTPEFDDSEIKKIDAEEKAVEYVQNPINQMRKPKPSKLRTPNSLHASIMAFLEQTKEN